MSTYHIQYSTKTAEAVYAAFVQLQSNGMVVTGADIARMIGKSRVIVGRILRDADWWTEDLALSAKREATRRSCQSYIANQSALGYPNLIKGRKTQKSQGYPNMAKGRKKLKEMRDCINTEEIRESRKIRNRNKLRKRYSEVDAEAAYMAFKRLESKGIIIANQDIAEAINKNASTVCYILANATWWTNKHRIAAHQKRIQPCNAKMALQGYPNRTSGIRASTIRRSGNPRSPMHARSIQGRVTRQAVWNNIQIWDYENRNNGTKKILKIIAQEVGISPSNVSLILKEFRINGLIDENNRPIKQEVTESESLHD